MMEDYPVIYRVMKRLEDNCLVSPSATGLFIKTSMTNNNVCQTIDYGFAFSRFETASYHAKHPSLFDAKMEVWIVKCEKYIPVLHELHSYQIYTKAQQYASLIGECFYKKEYSSLPIKIGRIMAPPDTIFCANINLYEKVYQNY